MSILVTGGTGYIGSNTCTALLQEGFDVVIADNLCNSELSAVSRIEQAAGKPVRFYPCDLCDSQQLESLFEKEPGIEAVIHFAGLKAVGESTEKPLLYYRNNLISTLNLLEIMDKHQVKKLVFSSSATVYGDPETLPIPEESPLKTTNPYGATKLMQEEILQNLYQADTSWNFVLLRYFNPVGAHESGLLGENPIGIPNNLMPYIVQAAQGKRPQLGIFGADYPTIDGTGVRDYIHVMDLAEGHAAALRYMEKRKGVAVFNLGTGRGVSVMELVKTFGACNQVKVPYVITQRRPGDIAACYADASKAAAELSWKAKRTLEDMCKDAWKAAVLSEKKR